MCVKLISEGGNAVFLQSGRADGKAHFEVYAIFVDSLKVNKKVLIYRCEYIEIVSQTVD